MNDWIIQSYTSKQNTLDIDKAPLRLVPTNYRETNKK
jgi:hypothetical protein